ncbi:hypothetical protein [Micromonospora sp. KC606]|uniref:hypothetical protein n=1 Tax=Micromonospora sp. KC606 TaxID=2530379 RepID=UPI0014049FDE|nr:hypothetical protein [Micromonospora sp. KC606]
MNRVRATRHRGDDTQLLDRIYGLRAHGAQMSPVITQIEPDPPVLADRSGAS